MPGPNGGMTAEYMIARHKVIGLASMIAKAAPVKRGKYSGCAEISWSLIEELRTALAELEANR